MAARVTRFAVALARAYVLAPERSHAGRGLLVTLWRECDWDDKRIDEALKKAGLKRPVASEGKNQDDQ